MLKRIFFVNLFFVIFIFLTGCTTDKNIRTSSNSYTPLTKTTRTNQKIESSTPMSITRTDEIPSSYKADKTEQKNILVAEKEKNVKKEIIQTSLNTSTTNVPNFESSSQQELLLDKNQYIIFKNISKYFGERKIKSIIFAVGDFNKWGKDQSIKYPVRVDNDEIKLNLFELPLLKGTNRIGFADYNGNLWQIKENLQKNKLISQSNNGDMVIGIIVTQNGIITYFNNGDKQKLIQDR